MNSGSNSRGIITLAYGHRRFVEQARSLAYSLQLHAPHLPRTLVTDSNDPEILRQFSNVIAYRPEYGSGVRQKLYLDMYSPYEETLFIDSDCLVLGHLADFWSVFAGNYFGVPGFRYLRKGSTDPFFDVDYVLDALQLTSIPKFNGGTYYFTRSAEATAFFRTSRKLMEDSRALRLGEFRRNGPADETLYSLAMAIHQVGPTWMGVRGMWTPCGYKGRLRLDVLKGTCSFQKEGMHLSPEIVHFPGEYVYAFPYARERARLKAHMQSKASPTLSLAAPCLTSLLWQCTRRSTGLAKIGRASVRAVRALRSRMTSAGQAKLQASKRAYQ
jgi:hypothetical protein